MDCSIKNIGLNEWKVDSWRDWKEVIVKIANTYFFLGLYKTWNASRQNKLFWEKIIPRQTYFPFLQLS